MQKQKKIGKDVIEMYKQYENPEMELQTTVISHHKFILDPRYEIANIIGEGAYSVVVDAKDLKAQNQADSLVAIKKIHKAFEHKIFAKRTLRELKLLRLLNHSNILDIKKIALPKSREDFEDVYVISGLMDTDLTEIIKSKQPLKEQHFKFFLYQLLRGLKYIHSAKVMHRDLKPRNILVNSNCDLKICDFGLARPIFKETKANLLTDYMTTRWYRAPELLLSATTYTYSVDMWSVGCIFAEMLQRKPLLKGGSAKEQFRLICQFLGTANLQNIKNISEEGAEMIKQILSKRKVNSKNISTMFPDAPPLAIDLLQKLLRFDPAQRISAVDALRHPYLADFHLQEDQPSRDQLNHLQFEFEDYNLTNQQLKDLLYEQALLYNNKQFYRKHQEKLQKNESLIEHILKNSNATNIDPEADDDD